MSIYTLAHALGVSDHEFDAFKGGIESGHGGWVMYYKLAVEPQKGA